MYHYFGNTLYIKDYLTTSFIRPCQLYRLGSESTINYSMLNNSVQEVVITTGISQLETKLRSNAINNVNFKILQVILSNTKLNTVHSSTSAIFEPEKTARLISIMRQAKLNS